MNENTPLLRSTARRSRGVLQEARRTLAKALAPEADRPTQVVGGLVPSDGTHAAVRRAMATSIRSRRPDLADVADALALGAHPWPDVLTTEALHRAIVAELNPWLNERHPDVREVVADRLLRLAEVFREHELSEEVWRPLGRAASSLIATTSLTAPVPSSAVPAVVEDVLGVGPDPDPSSVADVGGSAPTGAELAMVATLIGTVARSGSCDLGVNLGSDPSGLSVGIVLRATRFTEALRPLDEWIDGSTPRIRGLLIERVFTLDEAPTLQEIGERWGLTRERVRQLEVRARDEFRSSFSRTCDDLSVTLRPLRSWILPTDRFVTACRALGAGLEHGDAVAAALAAAAGPWVHENGWTYHQSIADRAKSAHEAIRASSDEYGLLPPDVATHLEALFCSEADQVEYLTTAVGVVELSGYWSVRDSQRTRVAAALRRIGRPASKAEIALEAGVSDVDRLGSTLSVLTGIVRADKERWAFADWVDDPYDGIVGEIYQRISRNHGSVAVASLLDELPRRFGVSEASVHAYLQTSAFLVEDGFVRRADGSAYAAAPPTKWPDAFVVGEVWGQLVRVDERHFAGYSFKVRFDIAYANGLRPNDDLRVAVDGSAAEASVIWRPHDATKAVDVGRMAEVLVERGLSAGDRVVICPSRTRVVIADWDEGLRRLDSDPGDEQDEEHHDPLFDLLGDA
jgi:hypothetical protein